MAKQKFEATVDVPEGYRIKDFRIAGGEDTVIRVLRDPTSMPIPVRIYAGYTPNPQPEFIIEKIPQYRDPALPADWNKPAQFSDDGITWVEGRLAAYASHYADDKDRWCGVGGSHWYKFCQVVDE